MSNRLVDEDRTVDRKDINGKCNEGSFAAFLSEVAKNESEFKKQ